MGAVTRAKRGAATYSQFHFADGITGELVVSQLLEETWQKTCMDHRSP